MYDSTLLPNRDIIETIINQSIPDKRHTGLLAAIISRTNLRGLRHSKSLDGIYQEGSLYNKAHTLIASSFHDWIKEQLELANGKAYAVWDKFKNEGMLYSTYNGSREYFTMPYGDEPDEFIQVEVIVWVESITHNAFRLRPWSPVSSPDDLLDSSGVGRGCSIENPFPTGKVFYEFVKIFDAAALIQKRDAMHMADQEAVRDRQFMVFNKMKGEYEDRSFDECLPGSKINPSNPVRLMNDWKNSSAGRAGNRFCDHWILNNSEWNDSNGKACISIVPYWTTSKPIKKIEYKKSITPYSIFDQALKIDQKSGYSFAWFFYMLHGNRISDWFGRLILKAAEDGLIVLPEHDYQILRAWNDDIYGF